MDCLTFDQMIYQYRYDVLEEEERAEMVQHVEYCEKCQQLLERSDKGIDLLGEWEIGSASSKLVEKTLQKVPATPPVKIHYARMRWAGLAAAVLLLSFLVFIFPPERRYHPNLSDAQKDKKRPVVRRKPTAATKNAKPASTPAKTVSPTCREERQPTNNTAVEDDENVEMDDEIEESGEAEEAFTKDYAMQDFENDSRYVRNESTLEKKKLPQAYAYFMDDQKGEEKDRAKTTKAKFKRVLVPIVSRKREKGVKQEALAENRPFHEAGLSSPEPECALKTNGNRVEKKEKEKREGSFTKHALVWEHPFVSPKQYPISRFSVNVSDTSYLNCRGSIYKGVLPPGEEVRVEEFVNHFSYEYPHPCGKEVFSMTAELGTCPWAPHNLLLHIGIQGKQSTRKLIARDAQAQVEFSPDRVEAYRLIGYENHVEDEYRDAKISAGRELTVLYEIIPGEAEKKNKLAYRKNALSGKTASGRIILLQLRYIQAVSENSSLVSLPVYEDSFYNPFPSQNFEWSAAVAGFAMLLRDSRYKGGLSYELVMELAQGAIGKDLQGQRDKFLEMVIMAKILSGK